MFSGLFGLRLRLLIVLLCYVALSLVAGELVCCFDVCCCGCVVGAVCLTDVAACLGWLFVSFVCVVDWCVVDCAVCVFYLPIAC